MQPFRFTFNDREHELLIPDGEWSLGCAAEIIEGKSYPFPALEPAQVVVDIGAHVGEFTIMAALVWPAATVHAYEPYPTAAKVLRHNMAALPNVIIHEQAVAAQAGLVPLCVSSMGTLCNSLAMREGHGQESIEVEAVSYHTIAALKPNVLKIDAEGVEWDILENLPCEGIQRIYVEFHDERDRQLIQRKLDQTHSLAYARIPNERQGELMYVRRKLIGG